LNISINLKNPNITQSKWGKKRTGSGDFVLKRYPEIIRGKETTIAVTPITMTKSDGVFLKFRPGLKQIEINRFLEDKKEVLERKFKPIDVRKIGKEPMKRRLFYKTKFDAHSIQRKNVFQIKKPADTEMNVDEQIGKLESDDRVVTANPVYFRHDLKYPNSFSFEDEIIVKFEEGASEGKMQALFEKMNLEKICELGTNTLLVKTKYAKKQNLYEVAQELENSREIKVQLVKINWIQLHDPLCGSCNARYFEDQWNLKKIKVKDAWKISSGSPLVVIAVVDTGCDLEHPDLISQLVKSDCWFDAYEGDNKPTDENSHGTLCAGVAVALPNSITPTGVAGVGYNCRIMPIRILKKDGFTPDTQLDAGRIIKALNFARCVEFWDKPSKGLKSQKHAQVVSMSFSYDGDDREFIDDALEKCHEADMVLVAAAGNYATDSPDIIAYPACNKNIIAVGASGIDDKRCEWGEITCDSSQFGKGLSVMAPGINIYGPDLRGPTPDELMDEMRAQMGGFTPLSLLYGSNNFGDYNSYFDYDRANTTNPKPQQTRPDIGDNIGDYYFKFHGTSAATPHVAGLAGLMLAYNPDLLPDDIKKVIQETADKVGSPNGGYKDGWNKYMGFGRINAKKALKKLKKDYPYQSADVYIRKSLADDGTDYDGELDVSPDIIARKMKESDPKITFSDKGVDPGSDKLGIGKNQFIYVRVHNKGTKASNIHARLYFTPYASKYQPRTWSYLDQYDFYDVASGKTAVSDAIVWKTVPDPSPDEDFCIIASIEGFGDCHPDPVGLANARETSVRRFFRINNNICMRKVELE